MKMLLSPALAIATVLPNLSLAAEPPSCEVVRFAVIGWSDVTVTTAMAREVLSRQKYRSQAVRLSVPEAYKALAEKRVDVFLGSWMPSMAEIANPYLKKGLVQDLGINLQGARYTLVVPQYLYDQGLKSFADIAKFKNELNARIYGIEPGNDGNQLIHKLIKSESYGLGDFQLMESDEEGMLFRAKRIMEAKRPIVFLGWEPHPMNTHYKIRYLEGGDDYFGPNYGAANVHTNVRAGYLEECPNLGKLLSNLKFSLAMENALMDAVFNERQNPRQAAKNWLKANPQALDTWLQGVSIFSLQASSSTAMK